MNTCSHCKSGEIIERLSFHLPGSAYGFLSYKNKEKQWTWDTEPLLADLCKSCGTIIRLYVENTDHPVWNTAEYKKKL